MYIVYTELMEKNTPNPNTHMISIRLDKETKEKAQEIFEKMGIDLSSAVKIFLHNVILNKAIPFEIKSEPNKSFKHFAKENLKKGLKELNHSDLDEDL